MEHTGQKIVLEASSVEDAVRRVAAELNVPESRLQATVLSEGKAFLGLFGRKLQVEIIVSPENCCNAPVDEQHIDNSENEKIRAKLLDDGDKFLTGLLNRMSLDAATHITGECSISIEGDDSGIVLGRYGDTLKAMEYLLNLSLRDTKDVPRLRLDCDGYRQRREANLQRIAVSAARKAMMRGGPVRLEPMASWERRIVHLTLQEHEHVMTESVGESPDRKVVVMPKVNPDDIQQSNRPKRRFRR